MLSRLRRTGKPPQSQQNRRFPFRIASFQPPTSLPQLRLPFLRPRPPLGSAVPAPTNPRPSPISSLVLPPPALFDEEVEEASSLPTATATATAIATETVSRAPSEQEELCTPPAEWVRDKHPDFAYISRGNGTHISVGSSSWQTLFQSVESDESDASSFQGTGVSSASLRAVRDVDSSDHSDEESMLNEGKHEDREKIISKDVELRTGGALIKAAKIVVNGPIIQQIQGTSVILEMGNSRIGEHERTIEH